MSKKLAYLVPALLALSACAHQGAVAPVVPQAQPEAHAIPNYVGAKVESLSAASTAEYMSREFKALTKALAEHTATDWQSTQLSDGSIRLQIPSKFAFDTNSAELRPVALDVCAKLARIAQEYNKTVLHIVVSGRDAKPIEFSQSLSDRRAAALAAYMSEQGLDETRLRDEGATSDKNGALIFLIKPVVAGAEPQAWASPS
ncbi:OmpA family protein [Stenotrophobium rhamnosiphilum]|uniref:OmpA-like domain-containing protein n=1 Tax=Stenotrophobium rhamnosiphilum TaxID=2029166 RepID=A0A2T5MEQ1_9GAMM|nr:OmpA family protein [Stenotrophobium rhamnosiphilum]PTU31061.1 hypothetical protein CJD38_12265 [Stenotrophobium rhamnosiphilum]